LKNTASQYENDWKDKYIKAKEYVRSQLGDNNLVDELLETSNKFVIDRVTREIVKQKEERTLQVRRSIFDEDTAKLTEEAIHDALSCQNNDGSLQLSDTVSKELKFESTNSLVSRVRLCLKYRKEEVPKNRELQHNEQLLHTAIILFFLKKTYPPELKEKYEKAEGYLKNKLESDENFKKLMEIIGTIINSERTIKEVREKGQS
jgi:hypothetical protein